MVYRQDPDEVRHRDWPLRLDPAVVLTRTACGVPLRRVRFFTPAARPLNVLQPTREGHFANEQPGCLHANMDVYRWRSKLSPLVSGDLVADCFELAGDPGPGHARQPVRPGGARIRSGTSGDRRGPGRVHRQQREFADRAAVLRRRLIDACRVIG